VSLISPKIFPKPADQKDRDLFFVLDSLVSEVKAILNGGIKFSDNFDAKMVSFTSSATPDAENTVTHTLGKIPTGYIVYSRNKAAVLYDGTTAWSTTSIYLKSNVASTAFKILVF
jgi:hypothetical protein